MTFSDKEVVTRIKKHFVPAWESVADVTTASYKLGDERVVKEVLSGEMVVYFCRPDGKVFDILPGLQSPGAMLSAMDEAIELFYSTDRARDVAAVQESHSNPLRTAMTSPHESGDADPTWFHSTYAAATALPKTRVAYVASIKSLESRIDGLKKRIREIRDSPDAATKDMRNAKNVVSVYGAAIAAGATFAPVYAGSTSVVNPVGRMHKRREIRALFAANVSLRPPEKWKKTIFEDVLSMPLNSRTVVYETP